MDKMLFYSRICDTSVGKPETSESAAINTSILPSGTENIAQDSEGIYYFSYNFSICFFCVDYFFYNMSYLMLKLFINTF